MEYRLIYRISIEHDYFPNSQCTVFRVAPTPTCQQLLADYRLIFKETLNGIEILAPVVPKDGSTSQMQLFQGFPEDLEFQFYLSLDDPDFAAITDFHESFGGGKINNLEFTNAFSFIKSGDNGKVGVLNVQNYLEQVTDTFNFNKSDTPRFLFLRQKPKFKVTYDLTIHLSPNQSTISQTMDNWSNFSLKNGFDIRGINLGIFDFLSEKNLFSDEDKQSLLEKHKPENNDQEGSSNETFNSHYASLFDNDNIDKPLITKTSVRLSPLTYSFDLLDEDGNVGLRFWYIGESDSPKVTISSITGVDLASSENDELDIFNAIINPPRKVKIRNEFAEPSEELLIVLKDWGTTHISQVVAAWLKHGIDHSKRTPDKDLTNSALNFFRIEKVGVGADANEEKMVNLRRNFLGNNKREQVISFGLTPSKQQISLFPDQAFSGIMVSFKKTQETDDDNEIIPKYKIEKHDIDPRQFFQTKNIIDFKLSEIDHLPFGIEDYDANLNRMEVGNLLFGRSSIRVNYPASPSLPWGKYARISLKTKPELFSQDVDQPVPNEFIIRFAPQKEFWSYLIMTSDGITENKYGIYKKDTVVVDTSSNEGSTGTTTPFYKFLVTQQGEILTVDEINQKHELPSVNVADSEKKKAFLGPFLDIVKSKAKNSLIEEELIEPIAIALAHQSAGFYQRQISNIIQKAKKSIPKNQTINFAFFLSKRRLKSSDEPAMLLKMTKNFEKVDINIPRHPPGKKYHITVLDFIERSEL